jgi:hypothetical protein
MEQMESTVAGEAGRVGPFGTEAHRGSVLTYCYYYYNVLNTNFVNEIMPQASRAG